MIDYLIAVGRKTIAYAGSTFLAGFVGEAVFADSETLVDAVLVGGRTAIVGASVLLSQELAHCSAPVAAIGKCHATRSRR